MKYSVLLAVSLVVLLICSCSLNDADKSGKIFGRITNSAGEGLSGINIDVRYGEKHISLSTGVNGNYEFQLPPLVTAKIVFAKDGYVSQEIFQILYGGENRKLDIILKLVHEDAYLEIEPGEVSFMNFGGELTVHVRTNVSFDIETIPDFLDCTLIDKSINLICDSNHMNVERKGMIVLKSELNSRDTLFVTQLAGPVLRIVNYQSKVNSTYIYNNYRVDFSEQIELISAKTPNSNLFFSLSDDKKSVIYSPLSTVNLFESIPVELVVMADNKTPLVFNVLLRLFVGSKPFSQIENENTCFTADNKYLWMFFQIGSNFTTQLKIFSTKDLSEIKSLTVDNLVGMSYNPYNNCMYLRTSRLMGNEYYNELLIYKAHSGEYVEKIVIGANKYILRDLKFSWNGLGILLYENIVRYIDTSNGNLFGDINSVPGLYDSNHENLIPHKISLCDNFRLFLLYGQNSSGRYFAYNLNPETKVIRLINNSNMKFVATGNVSPYAFYFDDYYSDNIICQNVSNAKVKTLNTQYLYINELAVIKSDNEIPDLFSTRNTIISGSTNAVFNFNPNTNSYYLNSSNDGELLLLNRSNTLYLFKSTSLSDFYKAAN